MTRVKQGGAILLAWGAWTLLPTVAPAGTLMRLRYQPGEHFTAVHESKWDANSVVKGQDVKIRRSQTIEMTQTVRDVAKTGEATVEHKFDRLQVRATGAGTEPLDFDSASTEPPKGQAALMAPAIKSLLATSFESRVDPRGRVLSTNSTQVWSELARKSTPQVAATLGNVVNEEVLKSMSGMAGLVLPDKEVEVGNTWKSTREMTMPLVGKQSAEVEYTYAGPSELEGEPREKVTYTMHMDLKPPTNLSFQMKVVSQEITGTIWLDAAAGRVTDQEMVQKMTLDIKVGDEQAQQDVVITRGSKLRPAKAEK